MASVDQLRAQYNAASEANRKAYDELHGGGWNTNYQREYEIAVRDNDKEAKARLEPIVKKLAARYKETQDEKNRLKKELAAAEKAAGEKKTKEAQAKGAAGVYDKALKELDVAKANLGGYQGEEKYNKAYLAAKQAFDNVVKAGKTPAQSLPIPEIEVKGLQPEGNQGGAGGAGTGEQTPITSYTDALKYFTKEGNTEALIQAQKALGRYGYTGNVVGKPDTGFGAALTKAATEYANLPEAWRPASLLDYLISPVSGAGTGGTGGAKSMTYYTPSTQAAGIVRSVIKAELKRDATATEIASLSKALNDYEKANPYITTKTGRTGGVDATEYIRGLILGQEKVVGKSGTKVVPKLISEYTTKKGAEQKLVTQDLMGTIRANGLEGLISQDQISTWANRIKNGEKADIIKNEIRANAKRGMPENVQKLIDSGNDLNTIYSPYKQAMASILELDPNSITLNDPTLRSAIGPEGEMSIYDYQKSLRKDPRWQYTNNARQTVSQGVMKVLQDFGFMG